MQGSWLQTLLPLTIIGFVMFRRWKALATPRPLQPRAMWIVPTLYAVLVGAMLWAMPPSSTGWAVFALGGLAGGVVGWQRARLLKLHIDPESGAVMIRQSPAGLAVIAGIFVLRRLFVPPQGSQGGNAVVKGAHPALPLATDALLGFALGTIVGYRIELWRRAKELRGSAAVTG